jgi:ABC-type transport system involved in multi-copper enzyme maturation permease subunit
MADRPLVYSMSAVDSIYGTPVLGAMFDAYPWVGNWLTPLWLVGFGALLGLAVLALLALVALSLRRVKGFGRLAEISLTLREGPLLPILAVTGTAAVFGIVAVGIVRSPLDMMESLARVPQLGPREYSFAIAAPSIEANPQPQQIAVSFRRNELAGLSFESTAEPVRVTAYGPDEPQQVWVEVAPGREVQARQSAPLLPLFPQDRVEKLYVRNLGTLPTTLTVTVKTRLAYPEVATVAYTAIGVVAVFLLYALQRALMPRISAVALATYKSEIAQATFFILMLLGATLLIAFEFVPYFTQGEDIKMLKTSGLTLIKIFGLIQAVWAASTSISEEVEGRTALTVLSKPIGRRGFILGKYLGILWTVAVMFIVLGTLLMITVAYKPIYDAPESSQADPTWQQCHSEMVSVVPGMALVFLETMVLAALSVAISTRLPMLANFVIVFAIYVLGHLTPLLVQSRAVNQFEIVKFFGYLISTIFPVLEYYDTEAAIVSGAPVGLDYLGVSLLYSLLYSAIAMLLALILFEDRDLA